MTVRYGVIFIALMVFTLEQTPLKADVKISGFSELLLGTWAGGGDRIASTDLCAYNSVSDAYLIRARGEGAGFSFILSQNMGDGEAAYLVHFARIGGSFVQLTPDASQAFTGANTVDQECNDVDNATLRVTVQADALSTVPAGQYSGRVTIIMEPN